MKLYKVHICLIGILILFSCSQKKRAKIVIIENTLDIKRSFETVELTPDFLKIDSLSHIGIKDLSSNKLLITQLVDNEGDGIMDLLLFQPEIGAKSRKEFEIVEISEDKKPKSETICYSRFVPERVDDYAWENDRVAFRMYGPTAQRMVENGVPGGTLSSGIDAWLKKVDYPIINKWYKKEIETDGTYHEDTGEGLDNFHVGISRGVGGIAIKTDSAYYFSKNYTKWRTITSGPIRTSFYLEIGRWDAGGISIRESKVISLDYRSNLSRFEISIDGTDKISAGLALHKKEGQVTNNEKEAWISYWQPHDGSKLGTAIISSPGYFVGYENYNVQEKDLSNTYAHLQVKENKVIYFAGYGWKESGQFKTRQDWESYLSLFAKKINNPLKILLVP